MSAPSRSDLEAGWAALRVGDAAAARAVFEPAHADAPSGETYEGLARTSYLEFDFRRAIDLWERGYAAYRDAGDNVRAVRVARTLAGMYGTIVGDGAVSAGWMSRALTLLAGAPDAAEAGWVALNNGMFEPDRARKEQCFGEALAAGRSVGDMDLEFAALAYLGASLVHGDRIEEGMILLDEALAAVAGGDVDDVSAVEEIFCQLFAACEHANDVTRADQWIRVGEAVAARRNLPAVSAFCHTHYGGVLTAAGRWSEAEVALVEAARMWDLGQRSGLRRGALVRLADLRVRQGRFEEAEQLLDGFNADADGDAARPLAAVHLARGRPELARDILQRALSRVDRMNTASAPLLALLVDANIAAGRLEDAAAAARELSACASMHPGQPALHASAALAQGRVCLAAGTGDAQACLREALAGFARAHLPVEVARSRLELAAVLLEDRPEVALAEAQAALDAFERLQAARDADAAAALVRTLGARPASGRRSAAGATTGGPAALTRREAEVLDLLGYGLSNPEISDRLFISRKTVEHHVASILAKLALRSRAEAAAYAARSKSASK
jgi:DNA-binding CsgD family transcriptional regulator